LQKFLQYIIVEFTPSIILLFLLLPCILRRIYAVALKSWNLLAVEDDFKDYLNKNAKYKSPCQESFSVLPQTWRPGFSLFFFFLIYLSLLLFYFTVLGTELRTSHIVGKQSTTELHPQSWDSIFSEALYSTFRKH
jgi:hypothetical protein